MRPALPCEKSGTEPSNTARHALRTGAVFLKSKHPVTRESMALLLVENAEHYPEIQWWEAITARDRCQWSCANLVLCQLWSCANCVLCQLSAANRFWFVNRAAPLFEPRCSVELDTA